jgi:hypothetical protein
MSSSRIKVVVACPLQVNGTHVGDADRKTNGDDIFSWNKVDMLGVCVIWIFTEAVRYAGIKSKRRG